MSESKRQLSFDQRLSIVDWLRANKERLNKNPKTLAEIGKQIGQVLGLTLTNPTVSRLCKSQDVKFRVARTKSGSRPNLQDGHTRDAFLAKILRRLCEDLAFEMTDEEREGLTTIVARRTPGKDYNELITQLESILQGDEKA